MGYSVHLKKNIIIACPAVTHKWGVAMQTRILLGGLLGSAVAFYKVHHR